MKLRILTEAGEREFEDMLYEVKEGRRNEIESEFLNSNPMSVNFQPEVKIMEFAFGSRFEMGKYLFETFENNGIGREILINNPGIWNWITYYWIDSLCPEENGRRKIQEDISRYIFRPSVAGGRAKKEQRHLILGAWEAYYLHGEFSRLLLSTPAHQHGDFAEQLSAYQDIMTNKALVEAAYKLYWDRKKNRPKVGASSRKRKGNVRRFILVADQLDLTYDLYGMEASKILEILPAEFDDWKE